MQVGKVGSGRGCKGLQEHTAHAGMATPAPTRPMVPKAILIFLFFIAVMLQGSTATVMHPSCCCGPCATSWLPRCQLKRQAVVHPGMRDPNSTTVHLYMCSAWM